MPLWLGATSVKRCQNVFGTISTLFNWILIIAVLYSHYCIYAVYIQQLWLGQGTTCGTNINETFNPCFWLVLIINCCAVCFNDSGLLKSAD